MNTFRIYFWTLLMAFILFGNIAQAKDDCPDCGMTNHPWYGGK